MTTSVRDQLLALRDPLCSAEIAASLLERDTLGPARRLAQVIRSAIAEVDGGVELLSRGQLASVAAPERSHAVVALFDDVLQRVAPALSARGAVLERIDSDCSVQTDGPALLRRCLLAVLRFSTSQPTAAGQVAIGWIVRDSLIGIRLSLAPSELPPTEAALNDGLETLRRFAEREGIELESTLGRATIEIVAWLPAVSGTDQ